MCSSCSSKFLSGYDPADWENFNSMYGGDDAFAGVTEPLSPYIRDNVKMGWDPSVAPLEFDEDGNLDLNMFDEDGNLREEWRTAIEGGIVSWDGSDIVSTSPRQQRAVDEMYEEIKRREEEEAYLQSLISAGLNLPKWAMIGGGIVGTFALLGFFLKKEDKKHE